MLGANSHINMKLKLMVLTALSIPTTAVAQNVYFGNLHAHTSYSDGSGKPEEAFRMACDVGLDFFAVTEHNHNKGDGKGDRRDGLMIATNPALYQGKPSSLIETADKRNRPGECVTIYGQEFSTISQGNHMNVFDVRRVIDVPNGEFDKLLPWLEVNKDSSDQIAVLQFNHPRSESRALKDYGRDDFGSGGETAWVQAMSPHVSLIEVLNAPALRDGTGQRTDAHQSEYFRYLNLGFRVAPSVGQDNHYKNWGKSTDARVAAIASSLSRETILEALRSRHAYATEDRNLSIIFRSGTALQGDRVIPPALGSELPLSVSVHDADEPNARYRIDVFKDAPGGKSASAPVDSFEIIGNTTSPFELDGIRYENNGEYVLLRITQFGVEDEDQEHAEDDKSWTAPIWFDGDQALQPPMVDESIRIVSLIPNPAGDDFQNERITIQNLSSVGISLKGWKVRDLSENVWPLDNAGLLASQQQATVMRAGADMSLNNAGDRIELVAPDGRVVQVVEYDSVTTDEAVQVKPN